MRKIIVFKYLLILILFSSSCKTVMNNELKIKRDNQKTNLQSFLEKDNYVKIELKKIASGHLCIFGQLNDVSGIFILDTGAGGTGIQMKTSEKNTIKLGKLKLTGQNLMLMNMDHVNNALEKMGIEKVDGVIGADILTKGQAIIDYTNLFLYLKE